MTESGLGSVEAKQPDVIDVVIACSEIGFGQILESHILSTQSWPVDAVPPGVFVEMAADHTCVTGDYRTSPAAVATVSANMTIQFMLLGWFDIVGDGLGTVTTTTVADSSRVYGQ